jgi:hypothetical protein
MPSINILATVIAVTAERHLYLHATFMAFISQAFLKTLQVCTPSDIYHWLQQVGAVLQMI